MPSLSTYIKLVLPLLVTNGAYFAEGVVIEGHELDDSDYNGQTRHEPKATNFDLPEVSDERQRLGVSANSCKWQMPASCKSVYDVVHGQKFQEDIFISSHAAKFRRCYDGLVKQLCDTSKCLSSVGYDGRCHTLLDLVSTKPKANAIFCMNWADSNGSMFTHSQDPKTILSSIKFLLSNYSKNFYRGQNQTYFCPFATFV